MIMADSFFIHGKIIKGSGYGKEIGFPTLNIDRKSFLRLGEKIKFGVYYGTVTLSRKDYKAGIVIGPLDNKGLPKIEAHLMGLNRDVYGEQAVFEIKKFIRKFKKYKNQEKLISQIKKDMLFVSKQ